MSDFAVIIGYQFDNEEYNSIILDTIEDVRVSSNSRVTEQPVVDGDIISDHMYRDPSTMTVNGTLSLNGSKVTVVNGKGSKLANFQELFEKIQKEGVKCDIIKLSLKNEDDIRFLQRHNMVLQSVSWTERINSMPYSMNFKEVITTEAIAYDVDIDDAYLPAITEPDTLSFTSTLIDWDMIYRSIIKILKDNDLIKDAFINALSALGNESLKALVPAAVAAVIVGVMTALNSTPVGWVITAVGAVVGAAVIMFKGIFNFFKSISKQAKYKIKAFVWTNNAKKNEAEISRFGDFVDKLYKEFESINSLIQVYQVSSNKPQEAMISIGDEYYVFTFTFNNVSQVYSLKVENIDSSITASQVNITTAPTNFGDLNNSNRLLQAKNTASVYLVYNPVVDSADDVTKSAEPDINDLRNYFIVVYNGDIEKFQEVVTKIIKQAIMNDIS